ncbi:hypothetical protein BATDEDRAFT_27075 [Batrachochytrium dendrobatidis JAM81]|uniref:Uncharacterized protein n=1 Tax=Batrachochytrium dendrobatidis (strain JAM81 / FGSC 10211) TaxID=684364 RepID=F4P9N6_BATDJ|nr:uncharacterized protein BATDEDRAFT_27075 [Batrachochytrium dendrobatidis JAM81]EGF77810.1 hypothetical protein BATDEDRAFT_27075 [Batrachochytrium dendrobatidis JAM81]|eukprot:XP_006681368.1 hypothetical protein BATDEDRAFT_27075 [Batrachochytrium dendrobatidis JAM81]
MQVCNTRLTRLARILVDIYDIDAKLHSRMNVHNLMWSIVWFHCYRSLTPVIALIANSSPRLTSVSELMTDDTVYPTKSNTLIVSVWPSVDRSIGVKVFPTGVVKEPPTDASTKKSALSWGNNRLDSYDTDQLSLSLTDGGKALQPYGPVPASVKESKIWSVS